MHPMLRKKYGTLLRPLALVSALAAADVCAAPADDAAGIALRADGPGAERPFIPLLAPSASYQVAAADTLRPEGAARPTTPTPPDDARGATAAPADNPPAPARDPSAAESLALRVDERLLAQRSDADAVPAFVQGLKISGETGRVTVIEGDAELRKRGTNVKADRIVYAPLEDQLQATGNVRIYREGDIFTGTSLDLKLDARTGSFLKSTYLLANDRARGSAERMEFLGKDHYRADEAVYTTCGPDSDDWYLNVKELKLDYGRDAGEVTNAQLNFLGMHILSVPSMSFALNSRRKSGFLAPSFGSTIQSGQELSVPYYWNIAPNRDLTITPRLMTKRGLQTNLAGRYIGESYQGDARVEWLPDDKLTHTNRSGLSLLHRQTFGSGWVGNLNFNRVSDDNYFTDLSSRIAATSQRTLTRDGSLSYAAPYFSIVARAQSFQTLQDPITPFAKPYHRIPQIGLTARKLDIGGFDLNFSGEYTRFTHPTDVMGNRLVANPSISYPLLSPGGYLTPKLSLHSTRYNLQQTAPGAPDGFVRSVPTFSLDSGLVFERAASYFGQNYTQTLEPRMYYLRVPVRDQSRFPVFDSGLPDLNFAQIFTDNIYSGQDRIADASQVTFGVTSRLLGSEKAGERIRVSFAQRYYFATQQVTLPGETPRTDRSSDFLAALSGEIAPRLTLDTALQYNPNSGATQRASVGVRWSPELSKTISAAYRYRRDLIEQIDLAAQWKFADNWYGVGRYNFSLLEGRLVEALGGFEYDGGCWVGRFVLQKFVTTAQRTTTAIFFQIELNGLSRLGSNPLDQLRRNIPGYTKLNEHQMPGARTMDRYE
jgi:LPS-assembly protein